MKKIIAILVCLLLVASFAVTAFAAEGVKYTLTADKTSVSRGDVVTYTIATNGIDSCKGLAMIIDYDKAVFEYVANSGAMVNTPAGALGFVKEANNKLTASMMTMGTTVAVTGEMFTLQMKVLDAAAFGDSQITLLDSAYTAADNSVVAVEGNSVKMSVVCASHTEETKVTKEATCKEAGEKVTTCKDCGATIKTETIAKLAHTEETKVTKEATCAAEGEKVTSCTVCKETLKTETIAKLAHTEETKTTKEATCAAEGEKVTSCTVCKETLKTETIAKLAHTLGAYTETKAPTCAAEGVKTATCSVCQGTVTEAIAALPHTLDEGVVTKAPTTKKEGVKTYTCTVCGGTETESIPKLQSPGTGDNSMIFAFVLLMVLSAAGVAVTVIGKKKVA